MYNLWNDKTPFPTLEETKVIKNIEYVNIHTAIKGEYQFLLGAAIIKHKGAFIHPGETPSEAKTTIIPF